MKNTMRDYETLTEPLTTRLANPRSWYHAASGRSVLALLVVLMVISSNLLVRVHAANGDLDPTFGTGGKVLTPGYLVDDGFDGATAIAIQSDSKIVAVGTATDSNFNQIVALVRYDTNGNLDPTFGVGGRVAVDFQNGGFGSNDLLRFDVAIQADGKIVVAGTVLASDFTTDIGLARYDTNGNPDPTFGIGGKLTTDFVGNNDGANALAIQSDGKIAVAGFATDSNYTIDYALVRYDTNGDPDATFGAGGKVITDFFGLNDYASDVAIQSDGRIVTVGTVRTVGTNTDFGLACYDSDGNLDVTFGTGGRVTTDLSGEYLDAGNSLAIQSDGKIVVVGTAAFAGTQYDFALLRYDSTGALDGSFGVGGVVTTDFFSGFDRGYDVAIQSDGSIVAVGNVNPDVSDVETFNDFGVARYDTNGNLDQTFGNGGKVTTDFLATDLARGVAITPDCKIVVAGFSWTLATGDSNFALARYDSGGCVVQPNQAPAVSITAPSSGAIFPVGTPVNFSGSFIDDLGDTHTAQWMFDGLTQAGTVNEANSSVVATHIFMTAGVYQVKLSVTDQLGASNSADTVGGLPAMVVIYDPSGGWVTGGGWINSPVGAYASDPSLTGKASFGFVSKYQHGANAPSGQTEFQFKTGNLNFHSTIYDWLVVAGARAQYKGSGTINGNGDYAFMLTAIDGNVVGGGGVDRFRMKIWNKITGGVIYDNQIGAGDNDGPTTALGGGSIVIHK